MTSTACLLHSSSRPEPPPQQLNGWSPGFSLLATSECCPPGMRQRENWSLSELSLVRQVGAGAASCVYYALCRRTHMPVAVKMYEKSKLSRLNRRQVEREIQIHSTLAHPHVVDFYAAFEDEQRLYLLMEFAAGGDLFDEVKRRGGRLSEREVVAGVLAPYLEALTYLHGRGVIHRDIKPENTVFTREGVLKVADFGLAINQEQERPVTRLGTLDYMAPEVLRCPDKQLPADNKQREDLTYGPAVDAWALGVLAYELLVGRPPFGMSCRDDTMRAICSACPPIPDWISPQAAAFITTALNPAAHLRSSVDALRMHPWILAYTSSSPAQQPCPPHTAIALRQEVSPIMKQAAAQQVRSRPAISSSGDEVLSTPVAVTTNTASGFNSWQQQDSTQAAAAHAQQLHTAFAATWQTAPAHQHASAQQTASLQASTLYGSTDSALSLLQPPLLHMQSVPLRVQALTTTSLAGGSQVFNMDALRLQQGPLGGGGGGGGVDAVSPQPSRTDTSTMGMRQPVLLQHPLSRSLHALPGGVAASLLCSAFRPASHDAAVSGAGQPAGMPPSLELQHHQDNRPASARRSCRLAASLSFTPGTNLGMQQYGSGAGVPLMQAAAMQSMNPHQQQQLQHHAQFHQQLQQQQQQQQQQHHHHQQQLLHLQEAQSATQMLNGSQERPAKRSMPRSMSLHMSLASHMNRSMSPMPLAAASIRPTTQHMLLQHMQPEPHMQHQQLQQQQAQLGNTAQQYLITSATPHHQTPQHLQPFSVNTHTSADRPRAAAMSYWRTDGVGWGAGPDPLASLSPLMQPQTTQVPHDLDLTGAQQAALSLHDLMDSSDSMSLASKLEAVSGGGTQGRQQQANNNMDLQAVAAALRLHKQQRHGRPAEVTPDHVQQLVNELTSPHAKRPMVQTQGYGAAGTPPPAMSSLPGQAAFSPSHHHHQLQQPGSALDTFELKSRPGSDTFLDSFRHLQASSSSGGSSALMGQLHNRLMGMHALQPAVPARPSPLGNHSGGGSRDSGFATGMLQHEGLTSIQDASKQAVSQQTNSSNHAMRSLGRSLAQLRMELMSGAPANTASPGSARAAGAHNPGGWAGDPSSVQARPASARSLSFKRRTPEISMDEVLATLRGFSSSSRGGPAVSGAPATSDCANEEVADAFKQHMVLSGEAGPLSSPQGTASGGPYDVGHRGGGEAEGWSRGVSKLRTSAALPHALRLQADGGPGLCHSMSVPCSPSNMSVPTRSQLQYTPEAPDGEAGQESGESDAMDVQHMGQAAAAHQAGSQHTQHSIPGTPAGWARTSQRPLSLDDTGSGQQAAARPSPSTSSLPVTRDVLRLRAVHCRSQSGAMPANLCQQDEVMAPSQQEPVLFTMGGLGPTSSRRGTTSGRAHGLASGAQITRARTPGPGSSHNALSIPELPRAFSPSPSMQASADLSRLACLVLQGSSSSLSVGSAAAAAGRMDVQEGVDAPRSLPEVHVLGGGGAGDAHPPYSAGTTRSAEALDWHQPSTLMQQLTQARGSVTIARASTSPGFHAAAAAAASSSSTQVFNLDPQQLVVPSLSTCTHSSIGRAGWSPGGMQAIGTDRPAAAPLPPSFSDMCAVPDYVTPSPSVTAHDLKLPSGQQPDLQPYPPPANTLQHHQGPHSTASLSGFEGIWDLPDLSFDTPLGLFSQAGNQRSAPVRSKTSEIP